SRPSTSDFLPPWWMTPYLPKRVPPRDLRHRHPLTIMTTEQHDHLRSARWPLRHLDRTLIRLGLAAHLHMSPRQPRRHQLYQPARQPVDHLRLEPRHDMDQLLRLLPQRPYHRHMTVTQTQVERPRGAIDGRKDLLHAKPAPPGDLIRWTVT